MKTDTENTLRVTLTLNRESNPEWYDRLISVTSGRARAEIVRSHLSLPRGTSQSQATRKPTESTPSRPPKIHQGPTVAKEIATPIAPVTGGVSNLNELPQNTVVAGGIAEISTPIKTEFVPSENQTVSSAPPRQSSGGGLAATLLKSGRTGV